MKLRSIIEDCPTLGELRAAERLGCWHEMIGWIVGSGIPHEEALNLVVLGRHLGVAAFNTRGSEIAYEDEFPPRIFINQTLDAALSRIE